ncbi:MAG: glutamate 5-kinase [Mahellales bacterium]|jgi:glutamate 5-kinase
MDSKRNSLKQCTRIVVKVGTSTITYPNGKLNLLRIEQLVRVLADLINQEKEIVLVTSGAIGVGASKLGLTYKPVTIQEKQAMAAIGQGILMQVYEKIFSEYGKIAAQILLTKDVITQADRKNNAKNTFETLLKYGVIPVVNENDTVATEEIEFGDNDTLSAVVAAIIDADLLIILSDIDGLYTKDPHKYANAKLISKVDKIDDDMLKDCEGTGSDFGTGGMKTKIMAARLCYDASINMVIINGDKPRNIYKVLKGEEIGTLFPGKSKREGVVNE